MRRSEGWHCQPRQTNKLTRRQHEIMALLAFGYTNQQIANQLAISRRTVQGHLTEVYRKLDVTSRLEVHASSTPIRIPSSMTTREAEVMRLLASGKLYKEIARALTISKHTVQSHCENIYAKLNVAGRAEAVAMCAGSLP